jgi:hypothetical protein
MKIEKRALLISVIEAVVISLSFVLVNVYENYDGYSRNYFYSCKENASFEFDIEDTDGTVYPAGTVFEVLYYNADGRLALYIYDDSIQADSDSSAIALEYGIDPYIRRVNPIVDLKIEDAHNSDELAKVFESLKNNVKKEFYIHCLISVAIGLSVFIVSCALFVLINNKLRNKHMVQYTVLLGLVVICVFLSIGWIIYMGRAL